MAQLNQNGDVYLTSEGLKELQEELKTLEAVKLPKLVKRVARARSFGDLTENSEYTNAREELAFVEGRIDELRGLISRAKLIRSKKNRDVVKLGCKVTVHANGDEFTYEVVGEWEADPGKKKISHNSPLGKALLGKKKGDTVEIEAPAGKIVYKIKKIH
jgi:transcription elongation factor GreA